jgi:hypothetical protein
VELLDPSINRSTGQSFAFSSGIDGQQVAVVLGMRLRLMKMADAVGTGRGARPAPFLIGTAFVSERYNWYVN